VLGGSASSGIVASTNLGYCLLIISNCSLTKAAFRSTSVKEVEQFARLRRGRGIERSLGRDRVSSGGAMSIAAKRDCSQCTKVSILKQERRNWSVSARTRITYLFLHIQLEDRIQSLANGRGLLEVICSNPYIRMLQIVALQKLTLLCRNSYIYPPTFR
jgi:hypothetical protein